VHHLRPHHPDSRLDWQKFRAKRNTDVQILIAAPQGANLVDTAHTRTAPFSIAYPPGNITLGDVFRKMVHSSLSFAFAGMALGLNRFRLLRGSCFSMLLD